MAPPPADRYADYASKIDEKTFLFQASINGLRVPGNDSVYVTSDAGRSWRAGCT